MRPDRGIDVMMRSCYRDLSFPNRPSTIHGRARSLRGRVLRQVVCFVGDNEQRWFMYYTGCLENQRSDLLSSLPLDGFTGMAVSSDGLHWTRPRIEQALTNTTDNVVLRQNDDMWWAFDTASVAVSDVQIMFSQNVNSEDGVYWMFYSGIGEEKQAMDTQEGSKLPFMRPGLAMSQDGIHWARIEGPHYSGALFEVGDQGAWDSMFVGRPQVLNCGNEDLRMYYHSFDVTDQKLKIGLATSKNGLSWEKADTLFSGSNSYSFDTKGAAAQCVAYDVDDEQFVMFYEAVDEEDRTSIGLAVSRDGLHNWEVYEKPVVTPGEPDSWDSYSVGTPWAVSMDQGKWRIYYSGTRQKARGSSTTQRGYPTGDLL